MPRYVACTPSAIGIHARQPAYTSFPIRIVIAVSPSPEMLVSP